MLNLTRLQHYLRHVNAREAPYLKRIKFGRVESLRGYFERAFQCASNSFLACFAEAAARIRADHPNKMPARISDSAIEGDCCKAFYQGPAPTVWLLHKCESIWQLAPLAKEYRVKIHSCRPSDFSDSLMEQIKAMAGTILEGECSPKKSSAKFD